MYNCYSWCMYLGVDNIQDKTKQGLCSGIFLSKMAERERPFSQNNGSLLSIAFSWSPERIVERGTEAKMWCGKLGVVSLQVSNFIVWLCGTKCCTWYLRKSQFSSSIPETQLVVIRKLEWYLRYFSHHYVLSRQFKPNKIYRSTSPAAGWLGRKPSYMHVT